MQRYRSAFSIALAGYALLTSPASCEQVRQYRLRLSENGPSILSPEDEPPTDRGPSQEIRFLRAVVDDEGRLVVDLAIERYLTVCYEEAKRYAKHVSRWEELMGRPWFKVVWLLRSAYSHDGCWFLPANADMPIRCDGLTIDPSMAGRPVRDSVSWYRQSQLCSRLILFVERHQL